MIRATQVRGQHRFTETPADTVVLDFDDRHRRRMAMSGTRGLEFLLALEAAVALRGGAALMLEDGRLVEGVADPARPRHRGDGQGFRRPHCRDRGAVRSGRRRLRVIRSRRSWSRWSWSPRP